MSDVRTGERAARVIKVGAVIRDSRGQASTGWGVGRGIEAPRPSPVPSRQPGSRNVRQQRPVGDRLARQQPERLHGRLLARVQARQAPTARVHHGQTLGRDGRAAVHHHQPIDALRMPGRERHRVVAAHGVADHGHPAPAEGIHDADQVAGEVLGGVRGLGRPLARAMAPLVEREHVVTVDESGHDRVEPVRVRGTAVEEAERRAARLAPLEGVQRQAADLEGTRTGGLASEAYGVDHAPHCTQAVGSVVTIRVVNWRTLSAHGQGGARGREPATTFSVTCRSIEMASRLLTFLSSPEFPWPYEPPNAIARKDDE